MDFNKKIKYLWGIPAYRVRLLFFVVLGVSAILASLIVQNPFWQDLLSNFAVTFAAVGFIDFMWDLLGGEPMEAKMIYSFGEVNQKIDAINQSMSIMSDLVNNQIGIERIWATRRDWARDQNDGNEVWIRRICQAEKVDIVSNTFDGWSKNEEFRKELLKSMNNRTKVRLLIYDPESSVLDLRSKHEKDFREGVVNTMKIEIKLTIGRFATLRSKLDSAEKDNLKIRLSQGYYHMAQIIRADERILITLYQSGITGSPSPTIQVSGLESKFFKLYENQFNILWNGYKDFDKGEGNKLISTVKELSEEDYQKYLTKNDFGA